MVNLTGDCLWKVYHFHFIKKFFQSNNSHTVRPIHFSYKPLVITLLWKGKSPGLGLDLELPWPWPWRCCPGIHPVPHQPFFLSENSMNGTFIWYKNFGSRLFQLVKKARVWRTDRNTMRNCVCIRSRTVNMYARPKHPMKVSRWHQFAGCVGIS